MRGQWPVHPLLFAGMPFATLLASNLGVISPGQVIGPLTLSLIAALLLLGLLRLALREWHTAGVLSSAILIAFFSYGHIYYWALAVAYTLLDLVLERVPAEALKLWLHPPLVGLWAIGLILAARLARRRHAQPQRTTALLNGIGLITLLLPLGQLLAVQLQLSPTGTSLPLSDLPSAASAEVVTNGAELAPAQPHPDIYYIVLDGYAGEPILSDIYAYDNREFLHLLASHGFYLATESRSNYAQTILSLASSLNMRYLDELVDLSQVEQVNALIPLLRQSEVRTFLEREGYSFVAFSTGYGRTAIPDADLYLQPKLQAAGALESLLVQTTALQLLEDAASELGLRFPYPGYQAHRQRILFTLDNLPRMVEVPGPKFVFVHLLIPHPPFVFGPAGEELLQTQEYALKDGSHFEGTQAEYIAGYRAQVAYINQRLSEIVPVIISESPVDPVIVIHGDHGPGARLDWDSQQTSDLRERFSILNAYRLPGVHTDSLYATITPVNSFRVILNSYFAAELPLLPDRSFFSSTERPLDFTPLWK